MGIYLDKVSVMGPYIHNVVEQLNKLTFHLKFSKQVSSFWNLGMKN